MTTPNSISTNPTADVPSDGTTNPNAETPNLTITRYQQLATEFMSGLDTLAAIIPKLEVKHVTTANLVKSHQNIPNPFLASTVAAVEQSSELQVLKKLDVPSSRDTLQFIEAFRTVADKLNGVAQTLEFTLRSRKAALAIPALQIYDIAKGLSRDPSSAGLALHVANMKRDLNRQRPRPQIPADVRKAARAAAAKTFAAVVADAKATAAAAATAKPPLPPDPLQRD
jgi:hypothetical protein